MRALPLEAFASSILQSLSVFRHLYRVSSRPLSRARSYIQTYLKWYLVILLVLWLTPPTSAEDQILNCSSITDNYVGNAQLKFQFRDWVNRGLCIRHGTDGGGPIKTFQCYSRLQYVISNNLNEIRKAEYSGAAGVLALLPTIGALLGTPTNEIWRLLTMIPFGGVLAMACSFGGAILPVKIKDYESAFMEKNIKGDLRAMESTLSLPLTKTENVNSRIKQRASILMDKIQQKLQSKKQRKVPKMYILVGLSGMFVLLAAAHVAMIVVELGAVLPWWCISKWWVHLWYMMVILSAAADNYVQLPFQRQWRLCLSDVPYDLAVTGGDFIGERISGGKDPTNDIETNLPQLKTLKTGSVRFIGPPQSNAEPCNVLFVLVSVTSQSHNWRQTFTRSLSKIISIAVFIVGTACFASAQLLSIAMATFVLACVLGAGVFGRAITSWIVAGIETADPMIHFVAETELEAHFILAQLFAIQLEDTAALKRRQVQVELNGHVFLDQRRITSRSTLAARALGILNKPYDLAKSVYKFSSEDEMMDDLENQDSGSGSGTGIAAALPLLRVAQRGKSAAVSDVDESLRVTERVLSRQSS
ncbi:hypothetical protein BDV96DRAFT_651716 [Lophiotrema nucula]|uniref:Uncharacterized protein n=1 Tax=Lophiotrema nucula TaxID=690887 RepID=A0A6A5YRM0_9PLEO|nr:hypothetical protein BDV96DRAFT_651716 [Lophiotrema nucula]